LAVPDAPGCRGAVWEGRIISAKARSQKKKGAEAPFF